MSDFSQQHRFIVRTDALDSRLICGYQLSKTRLVLTTFIEQSNKILSYVEKARTVTSIQIQQLDADGRDDDTITVKSPILLDWNVDASWSSDKPLELKLTYGFNKLD